MAEAARIFWAKVRKNRYNQYGQPLKYFLQARTRQPAESQLSLSASTMRYIGRFYKLACDGFAAIVP